MAESRWIPSIAEGDTTSNNIHEFVVPKTESWHIMSIWCSLGTSNAGGGVRQLRLAFYSSSGAAATDLFLEIRPGLTQDSELTYYYNFYPGAADITSVRDSDYVSVPIPATLVLNPYWTIILEDESSRTEELRNARLRVGVWTALVLLSTWLAVTLCDLSLVGWLDWWMIGAVASLLCLWQLATALRRLR